NETDAPASQPGPAAVFRESALRAEGATEEYGDGVLVPALVLGLGGFGVEVLRRLRAGLQDRFGDPAALAHVQLLGIDTDPAGPEAPPRGAVARGRPRDEALRARLSRSSHYLRPRDPLPRVEDWLPPRALHRLSRTPATNGSRALGRLA